LATEHQQREASQYSYTELNNEINRTANLFYSLGITKGNKVALHLNNCAEFIFCWFGLAKIGAIVVPINANLLRDESAYIINQCEATLVVTSVEFYSIYADLKQQGSSSLRQIMLIDNNAEALLASDVLYFQQMKKCQPDTLLSSVEINSEDTAEILFTSGTTSSPKGVVITHHNLLFAGYYTAWQCALRSDDIYLTPMPAFHIDCQCTAAMPTFTVGATFVLLEKYSARAFWGQVCQYRAT
ncbi:crotonobetaine/carnitine-CoA ligase, partial [Salmonella enterica]|nr:crotonobetaine/carnitine-CoA ligase [Salmonella enterica]